MNRLSLLLWVALAACNGPAPQNPQAQANAATLAACRQRADQVYERQNRGRIYSPQSAVNTPYSAGYAPGQTDIGLSQLFARDSMIRDCVRNTGTETQRGVAPGLRNTP
ncbi:MAG: hypothetical protein JO227_05475 [Acetobacteraceae bacterium]|nr:hypothetical protein [Acetobacteraceae bacterium]